MTEVDLVRAVARFLAVVTERQMEDAPAAELAEELRRLADRVEGAT